MNFNIFKENIFFLTFHKKNKISPFFPIYYCAMTNHVKPFNMPTKENYESKLSESFPPSRPISDYFYKPKID